MGLRASFVALVFVVSMCLHGASVAQDQDVDDRIQSKESELQELRRRIAEQREKIKEVEKKEKSELEYIRRLEKEEKLTRKLMAGLEEKEGMYQEQVDGLRLDLTGNETIYAQRLGTLSKRLREMYKEGPQAMWQELLNADDFDDLMQRYKFLTLIAEQDAELVKEVRDRGAEIERQEAAITETLHEISVAKREKEAELGRLRENERKRKATLRELGDSKKVYQAKIDELAESEKKLLDFIEELEKRRLGQAQDWTDYGESDFGKLKGRLNRPVAGNTVRDFGRFRHPEFGTVTFNSGIDIDARIGSPVRSVAKGRVEYVDALPGYGNCIIINHGGGYYTLYAHAERSFVSQGDKVESGAVIAEVGDTEGSPIHFEIRKSKTALDPGEWLRR